LRNLLLDRDMGLARPTVGRARGKQGYGCVNRRRALACRPVSERMAGLYWEIGLFTGEVRKVPEDAY